MSVTSISSVPEFMVLYYGECFLDFKIKPYMKRFPFAFLANGQQKSRVELMLYLTLRLT